MASPYYAAKPVLEDYLRKRKAIAAIPGNMTYQNAPDPVAGPYSQGSVRTGGGLNLAYGAGPMSPSLSRALGMAQTTRLSPAPAAKPAGPFDAPGSALAFSELWNRRPDPNSAGFIPGSEGHASKAFVVPNRFDGGTHVRLAGSGGSAMDMDKRNAYLADREMEMTMRRGGARASALAEFLGIGRGPGVIDNAMARGAARRQRIANRQRGLSPLEMMAARNPRLAMALAEMQQRGQLTRESNALREKLGFGELDVRRGGQELQYGLGLQQGADRRYVSDKDLEGKRYVADREMEGGGLAAILQFGTPDQKRSALAKLAPGAGVLAPRDEGLTTAELSPQQIQALDQASPAEAKQAMKNMGVSESSIERHLRQRRREYESSQRGWNAATRAFPFTFPGALAADIFGNRGNPVELNPEAVARLTPEQRRRLGIPEPKPKSNY